MPKREGGFVHMECCSVSDRVSNDKEWQAHWYRHVLPFVAGKSVLDAGSASGYSLPMFQRAGATYVEGFDLLPLNERVRQGRIEDYPDASFDLVTAMDVIEHVVDDADFFRNLLRVAREAVFFSTPNWNVSRAKNQFHVREYTPMELKRFLVENAPSYALSIWVSGPLFEIETREGFDADEACNNYGVLVQAPK